MRLNPVILKIGGSVITEKGSVSSAKKDEIKRISKEIASCARDVPLILVHGAGSFGHPQAMKSGLNKEFNAEGAYLTHVSVKELNDMVIEALNKNGVHALPVHPLSACLLENGKIIDFQLGQVRVMLERGIIPVFHGDVVMDTIKGASILSGDRILPYIGFKLNAQRIGAGSDVDGVLDDKGSVIKKITSLNFQDVRKHISGSRSTDVTGGMLGKVSEFLELAENGIDSYIFNASKKDMVSGFLSGKDEGTLVTTTQ